MSVPAWRTHYTPVALVYVVSELENSRLQTRKAWKICSNLSVGHWDWTGPKRRSTTYSTVLYVFRAVLYLSNI